MTIATAMTVAVTSKTLRIVLSLIICLFLEGQPDALRQTVFLPL